MADRPFEMRERLPSKVFLVWLTALLVSIAGSAWAQTVTFTSFAVPTANPGISSITAGSDGAMWFVENNTGNIGKISTAGVLTEFPTSIAQGTCTAQIASGPDGNLWVTFGNALGPGTHGPVLRVNTAGTITGSFQTPQPASCAASITTGPDRALWLGELVLTGDRIGRLTTDGSFSEFSIPRGGGPEPLGIATGPDGDLWFTEFAAFRVGQVTTSGVFTEYLLPGISFNGTSYTGPVLDEPFSIVAGPDGALWFTEYGTDKIGRITTAGAFTEFPLPTAKAYPSSIVVGTDGALWFSEGGAEQLGRITTAGVVTEFPVTTQGGIGALALGPDGALWFGQSGGIGRATAAPEPADAGIPSDAGGAVDSGGAPDGGNDRAASGCGCALSAGSGRGGFGFAGVAGLTALARYARRSKRRSIRFLS
jgi:virginiamycin B lyase